MNKLYIGLLLFLLFVIISPIISIIITEKWTLRDNDLIEVRQFFDSIKPCTYYLSREEIQERVDNLAHTPLNLLLNDASVSYKSVAELILLSYKAIPVLIDNLNRTEDGTIAIINPKDSFEPYANYGKNTAGETVNLILIRITGINFAGYDESRGRYYINESNVENTIFQAKDWYNKNKDFLVCDPKTGKTIVVNQTKEVS